MAAAEWGVLAGKFCPLSPWTFLPALLTAQTTSRAPFSSVSCFGCMGPCRRSSCSQSILCPWQATLPDPSHSQRETNSVELEASASTVTLCFAFTTMSTDGSGMARVFQILIINYTVSSIGCCVLGPMEDSSYMLGQGKCCFQHMLIYFHD